MYNNCLSALLAAGLLSSMLGTWPLELRAEEAPAQALRVIDLETAIRRAWSNAPALNMAEDAIRSMQAEELQEGVFPNPEISVGVDDFNNVVYRRQEGDYEISYNLSQLIELGGKRSARQKLATQATLVTQREYEIQRQDLRLAVVTAFVEVMGAQENLMVVQDQFKLAQQALHAASCKAEAGKVPNLEAKKAEIALSRTLLLQERAQRNLGLTKKRLSAIWGSNCPDFDGVWLPFYEICPLPTLHSLCARLQNQGANPDLAKLEAEAEAACAAETLERAKKIPDVVLSAGYNQYRLGNNSVSVGISFPLPIFDRNQGHICRAQWDLQQVLDAQQAELNRLHLALADAHEEWTNAYQDAHILKEEVLPMTLAAFENSKEGYLQGKTDYLDLLDTQRTYFETHEEYIKVLVDYHQKQAVIQRIVGYKD